MKDTLAMETCVSPKPISAESPWFRKTAIIRPYHNVPFRRNSMQSWEESSSTAEGQVILRIGDAPCDSTQGATEPERAPASREDDGEKPFTAEKEKTTVCQYYGAIVSLASTTYPQQTVNDQQTTGQYSTFTPRSLVIGSEDTSCTVDGQPWKNTPHHKPETWVQGVPSDNHGKKADESLSTATHSIPLMPPLSSSHGNQKETSNLVQYSNYHRVHHSTISSSASPTEGPGNQQINASLNPRKPSNLSDIERQRGPLKKRHIHFQPEVLDLSVKRLKSEPGSNMGQIKDEKFPTSCVQSSQSVGVKPVHRQLHQSFHTTVKQEQLSEVNEMGKPETQSYRGVFRTGEALDMERPDAGITHSGQRLLPPSFQGFPPGELTHGTFTGTFSNIYGPGGIPVPHNTELVRRWVLQVTRNNEMHAMQHLQAQVVPDLESNFSSAASDASQGSMVSLPKFNASTRGHRNAASLQEKPYACEHCSSTFKHRHHVVRHMRAHNGERPFHCPDCGAAFARKCVLTNHRRTHTGEKPYICTECGDTFSRKHHLVIHQRTHSGEKPYRCLDCGAAFARSHHVNRHRRTHEKTQEESDNVSLDTTRSPSTSEIEHIPTLAKAGTELMVPPITRINVTAPADAQNELVSPPSVAPGSPGVLTESGTARSPTYTQDTPVTYPSGSVDPQNGQVQLVGL